MINTSSIIDGFKVLLGSLPIHIAMTLTMLIMIRIPECSTSDDEKCPANHLYYLTLSVHVLVSFILVTSQIYNIPCFKIGEQLHIFAFLF